MQVFKNFPILTTVFVMMFVVGMKGIFVDCEENLPCLLIDLPSAFGCKTCTFNIHP